jgi:hypothetical protein
VILKMKKTYSKPTVESEAAFEVLAAGCTFNDPSSNTNCDPDFGFTVDQSGTPI